MEKNPNTSEEKEESSENGEGKMKEWFQENLRMLVSIVIVVAIAGGIYAYSKRTQPPTVGDQQAVSDEGEGKISVIGGEDANQQAPSNDQSAPENQAAEPAQKPAEAVPAQPAGASQETETAFVETAARGDSTTKLARRALANYLEKNPDTSLTAEHKVYIEDFLRRQVPNHTLGIGESREFSKDTIAKAIEKSKGLSEKQLKNLQKFSKKVPALHG